MKRTRGFVLDKVEHRDTIPDGTEQRIAIGREENIPLLVNRAAYVGELRGRVRSRPSADSRDAHLVVRLHFFLAIAFQASEQQGQTSIRALWPGPARIESACSVQIRASDSHSWTHTVEYM